VWGEEGEHLKKENNSSRCTFGMTDQKLEKLGGSGAKQGGATFAGMRFAKKTEEIEKKALTNRTKGLKQQNQQAGENISVETHSGCKTRWLGGGGVMSTSGRHPCISHFCVCKGRGHENLKG